MAEDYNKRATENLSTAKQAEANFAAYSIILDNITRKFSEFEQNLTAMDTIIELASNLDSMTKKTAEYDEALKKLIPGLKTADDEFADSMAESIKQIKDFDKAVKDAATVLDKMPKKFEELYKNATGKNKEAMDAAKKKQEDKANASTKTGPEESKSQQEGFFNSMSGFAQKYYKFEAYRRDKGAMFQTLASDKASPQNKAMAKGALVAQAVLEIGKAITKSLGAPFKLFSNMKSLKGLEGITEVLQSFSDVISNTFDAITSMLTNIMPTNLLEGITNILQSMLNAITTVMNLIIDSSPMLQGVLKLIMKMVNLILMPIGNIIAMVLLPIIRNSLPKILDLVKKGASFMNKPADFFKSSEFKDFLKETGSVLGEFIADIIETLSPIIETLFVNIVPAFVKEVSASVDTFITAIINIINDESVVNAMVTLIQTVASRLIFGDGGLINIPGDGKSSATQTQQERAFYRGRATADGGIVTSPQHRLVGEAGAEAIIPLSKANGLGGVTVNFYGDVYGWDDFNSKVEQSINGYNTRMRFR